MKIVTIISKTLWESSQLSWVKEWCRGLTWLTNINILYYLHFIKTQGSVRSLDQQLIIAAIFILLYCCITKYYKILQLNPITQVAPIIESIGQKSQDISFTEPRDELEHWDNALTFKRHRCHSFIMIIQQIIWSHKECQLHWHS